MKSVGSDIYCIVKLPAQYRGNFLNVTHVGYPLSVVVGWNSLRKSEFCESIFGVHRYIQNYGLGLQINLWFCNYKYYFLN